MSTNIADESCIFCKIIAKQIPSQIIYEDDEFLAFNDIRPAMPVHFLIIPKQHIAKLSDFKDLDDENKKAVELLGKMMFLAPKLAAQQGLTDFKLKLHNGKSAGQEVFHLHLHVMGEP